MENFKGKRVIFPKFHRRYLHKVKTLISSFTKLHQVYSVNMIDVGIENWMIERGFEREKYKRTITQSKDLWLLFLKFVLALNVTIRECRRSKKLLLLRLWKYPGFVKHTPREISTTYVFIIISHKTVLKWKQSMLSIWYQLLRKMKWVFPFWACKILAKENWNNLQKLYQLKIPITFNVCLFFVWLTKRLWLC